MTPWVLRLIFANVAVFFLTTANPALREQLAFWPPAMFARPWTWLTYMFVHAPGLWHILFNMLALYFFGPRVESRLGSGRFIALYLISGVAGAALSLFQPSASIVGASGAVFGVFLAYARFWPHDRIYIWGILPVEARLLVLLTTAFAVFGGVVGFGQIAHWAHLGGYVGAWLFLEYLGHSSAQREFRKKMDTALYGNRNPIVSDDLRPELIPRDGLHPLNVEELDRLSEKMKVHGASSLTSDERAFLHRMRSRYS